MAPGWFNVRTAPIPHLNCRTDRKKRGIIRRAALKKRPALPKSLPTLASRCHGRSFILPISHSEPHHPMTSQNIETLLKELRRNELPRAPDLRREVRMEIARRRAQPNFWQRWFPVAPWTDLPQQPRMAVGALAMALAVGIIPGTLGRPNARTDDARFARASLHLDAFSAMHGSLLPTQPLTTHKN